MPQDLVAKKRSFITRYSSEIASLLSIADRLIPLNKEFADMAYGIGGAQALTDVDIQEVLPASTAALFNSGQASSVNVLDEVASVRSALEWMRS